MEATKKGKFPDFSILFEDSVTTSYTYVATSGHGRGAGSFSFIMKVPGDVPRVRVYLSDIYSSQRHTFFAILVQPRSSQGYAIWHYWSGKRSWFQLIFVLISNHPFLVDNNLVDETNQPFCK